jgi:hypothetical protein
MRFKLGNEFISYIHNTKNESLDLESKYFDFRSKLELL